MLLAAACAIALGACRSARGKASGERLTPAGLGPVRIGMSVEELEAIPGRTVSVEPRARTGCGYAQPLARDAGFAVMLDAGTVVRVDVTGPGIRTEEGVGVGDAEAAVFAAYGRDRVETAAHEYVPGGHYLAVAPPGAGAAIVFETDGAVVTAIRAGWLPHVTFSEGCE
ncbi:MAG: hypothetical protein EDX89_23990 [Acidobacteria bacterium]|nr:MAG: hypothetical protein EDX89_23990 [Acidobacteriota bacterium]